MAGVLPSLLHLETHPLRLHLPLLDLPQPKLTALRPVLPI